VGPKPVVIVALVGCMAVALTGCPGGGEPRGDLAPEAVAAFTCGQVARAQHAKRVDSALTDVDTVRAFAAAVHLPAPKAWEEGHDSSAVWCWVRARSGRWPYRLYGTAGFSAAGAIFVAKCDRRSCVSFPGVPPEKLTQVRREVTG
jgi:hypothetical protein